MMIVFGFFTIVLLFFMQRITTYDQHDYALLRETTESAMYDSLDETELQNGKIKINAKEFRKKFIKKFADNAALNKTYKVYIYDINEEPPKVSIKVVSTANENSFNIGEFTITNKVDAILESKK